MSTLRLIYGKKRGLGKTSLNTAFAIWEMFDKNNYINCLSEIELLKCEMGREFKLPTQPHCVFSDYEIWDNCKYSRGLSTYPFNPYKFKLPNKKSAYDIYPPGSFFHINEVQTKYNSRKFKKFTMAVSGAYESSRHPNFTITMDGLGLTSVDSKIRGIVDEFILVLSMDHEYLFGRVVKTTWHCLVFSDIESAEAYESTKDSKLGIPTDYTFDYGCIFSCYKSRGNKKAFYLNADDHDFEYKKWDDIDESFMLPTDDFYLE